MGVLVKLVQNNQFTPPSLSALMSELKKDIFNNLNCINVGIIQSFDEADQTATIRVAIKRVIEIKDDGTKVLRERPLLLKCPVVILFGGSTYMTFPIAEGDECLVLFNDREIDNFWTTGSVEAPSSPRAHSASDAIALVGIRSLQKSIENYLTTGIRLSHETARIDLTQDQIDSVASLFLHTGDFEATGDAAVGGSIDVTVDGDFGGDVSVAGNLSVVGDMKGTGGTITIDDNIVQTPGNTLSAGNGASGTFTTVTVVDGIVTGGS